MRLLIDDDSTCSKDRACAQQPDKTGMTTWLEQAARVAKWSLVLR